MKWVFAVAVLLVFLSGTHAFAWTGGPFDNGDYSILLERGGVYQCTFSFRNGSGMALFNENNSFEVATGTTVTGMFSINNRSVFYYKGVTYFGTATGIVDVDARRVTGFTNGSSDYASTTPRGVGPFAQQGTGMARPESIGFNGNSGLVANSTFAAHITSTRPVLRFRGAGSVAFTGFPDFFEIHLGFEALVDPTNTGILPPGPNNANLDQAASYINTVIDLAGVMSNPSFPEAWQESQHMRVYGSRRFF